MKSPPKYLTVSFDHEFSAPVILPSVDTRGLRHNVVTYVLATKPRPRTAKKRGRK